MCFSIAFLLVGQKRVLSYSSQGVQLLGFTLVSTFRWACDCWLLIMAILECCVHADRQLLCASDVVHSESQETG